MDGVNNVAEAMGRLEMSLKCGVCNETKEDAAWASVKECGHRFHMECLHDALNQNAICPECQQACTGYTEVKQPEVKQTEVKQPEVLTLKRPEVKNHGSDSSSGYDFDDQGGDYVDRRYGQQSRKRSQPRGCLSDQELLGVSLWKDWKEAEASTILDNVHMELERALLGQEAIMRKFPNVEFSFVANRKRTSFLHRIDDQIERMERKIASWKRTKRWYKQLEAPGKAFLEYQKEILRVQMMTADGALGDGADYRDERRSEFKRRRMKAQFSTV